MSKEYVSPKPLTRRVTVLRNSRNEELDNKPSLFEVLAALKPMPEEFPDVEKGLRKLSEDE